MRCVGSANPPCDRCAKAKRPCVITNRNKTQPSSTMRGTSVLDHHDSKRRASEFAFSSNVSPSHRDNYRRSDVSFGNFYPEQALPDRTTKSPEQHRQPSSQPASTSSGETPAEARSQPRGVLPSVFSNSQLNISADLESAYLDESPGEPGGRSGHGARSSVSTSTTYGSNSSEEIVLTAVERDIYHLVDFFHSKMAMQTPIFLPDDFSDKRRMIRERRPLAICIAFVTARFVPGCRSLRNQLIPDVLNILKMAWDRIDDNVEHQRTLFQAFGVLSTYSSPADTQTTESGQARYGEFSPWALRSTVESYSLRISLHRSWDHVSKTRFNTPTEALADPSFRRYLLWLWLYTMSHHGALLMRSPPTIREDMSIRSAPSILSHLKDEYLIKRVCAEVELCLLWSSSSSQTQELGEWWCSPQSTGAIDSRLEGLRTLDSSLVSWSERWQLMNRDDLGFPPINSLQRTSIDFHFRFTRFAIATFVTRFFHLSAMEHRSDGSRDQTPTPPTTILIELLIQTMQAAMALCTLPLELSPIQKDIARYIPHLAFAMLAFPCFFVIRAAEIPGIPSATVREYFIDIRRAADVFCELAADEYHCAAIYGKAILAELARTEDALAERSAKAIANAQAIASSAHTEPAVAQQANAMLQNPEQMMNGNFQPDAMDFTTQMPNMFQWQSLDAFNSPNQFANFGDIEGWFVNNFWDP